MELPSGSSLPLGAGRRRGAEGVRERPWRRLEGDELADLPARGKTQTPDRLEALESLRRFGAALPGARAAGRVVEVQRGACLVELFPAPETSAAGLRPAVLRAAPRGLLEQFDLGMACLAAAGDEVEVVARPVQGAEECEAVLAEVKPRRSEFRRVHPSARALQTLAANVTQVAVVASAGEPPFRPGFVDRVWTCAIASNLPALLVCNKLDLGLRDEDRELLEVYRRLGLKVLETSTRTGSGLDLLRAALTGQATVLCGHSGVGKSSLVAALAPEHAERVRVGEVSTRTQKGQHVTSHPRLYSFSGGWVVDTPGLREFTPAGVDRRNLWSFFPEIAACREACAFPNCTHAVEAGCEVLKAVAEGRIHPRRHESYLRLLHTLPT